MITYLLYLLVCLVTLFFTSWLNAKFIKDVSGRDQYWHIVQLYQICWIHLSYILLIWFSTSEFPIVFCSVILGFGFMYILLYNSLLNIMRTLAISHLGRYDFFKFNTTLILAGLGLAWLIVYGVFIL